MIPIIELETWIGIIITVSIIVLRLYYCSSRFDHTFLINFLTIAIITSLIWFLYGYSIGMKGLALPFGISIIIYVLVIIYLTYCDYKGIPSGSFA
jgi:hypothetical protein